MIAYVPSVNVPTKRRYDVYKNGKMVLSTFNELNAKCEYHMSATDDVEIKVINVAK